MSPLFYVFCSKLVLTNSQNSLQSFSVPGTIFLSFLGGALFGLVPGILAVAFVRLLLIICKMSKRWSADVLKWRFDSYRHVVPQERSS